MGSMTQWNPCSLWNKTRGLSLNVRGNSSLVLGGLHHLFLLTSVPGDSVCSINVDKDYPEWELRLAQCVWLAPVMNSYCVEILGMTIIGKLKLNNTIHAFQNFYKVMPS